MSSVERRFGQLVLMKLEGNEVEVCCIHSHSEMKADSSRENTLFLKLDSNEMIGSQRSWQKLVGWRE